MSRLSVELVPATAWWTNVGSNVTRAQWGVCKDCVKQRSGKRCEICGGQGSRYPVDCHEIWDYNDHRQIQTLIGLIALCPACHEVKHIGRAMATGHFERALHHLAKVNNWSRAHADEYVAVQLQIHAIRSTHRWTLDISWLQQLGIEVQSEATRRP